MTLPKIISVAGPVIIENGKVLLIKSKGKDTEESNWKFPGGKKEESDVDFEATCRREAKEELDIDLEIKELLDTMEIKQKDKIFNLIHYLAERKGEVNPQNEVSRWNWLDINDLPNDCESNVYKVIDKYKREMENISEMKINKK